MAREFADMAGEFTATIRKLGPSPLKDSNPKSVSTNSKRILFRDMLAHIDKTLSSVSTDFHQVYPGFGLTTLDKEKCLGCGACAFVCKDGAMDLALKEESVVLGKVYWKCTSCGMCRDICPRECIAMASEFDLARFLAMEGEILAEVGRIKCERCDREYLPVELASEMEKILEGQDRDNMYVGFCPECRTLAQAERLKNAMGYGRDGIGRNTWIRSGAISK
jgi:formate hydrogenlyase subunit 6/NADH:ubiquinone oxidoreductase subunit I